VIGTLKKFLAGKNPVTSELEFKAKLWILTILTKLRFELQYPHHRQIDRQKKFITSNFKTIFYIISNKSKKST